MKTKKQLLIVSLLALSLCFANLNAQADVELSSVEYPTEVEVGEQIKITAHFSYGPTEHLIGTHVYFYYEINDAIDIHSNYESAAFPPSFKTPASLSVYIPLSELEAGDKIYFNIKYSWMSSLQEIEYTETSETYEIAISGTEPTDETDTGIIPTAGLFVAFASLAIIVIIRKKITR